MITNWRQVFYAPDDGDGNGTLLGGEQPKEGGSPDQQNEPDQSTNDTQQGGGDQTPNGWTTSIKKDVREKYQDQLKDFNGPTELVENYFSTKQKLENAVVKPGEDASEEDLAAYRKAMGIPDSPDGYEIEGDIDDGTKKELQKMFHDSQLSTDQAKKVHESVANLVQEKAQAEVRKYQQTKQNNEAELRKEWGDNYPVELEYASRAAKEYGVYEMLSQHWLGNDAKLLKAFAQIGRTISSDNTVPKTQGSGTKTNNVPFNFPSMQK